MGKVNPTTLSTGDKRGVANQPAIRGETAYKSAYARPDNATVDQKQAFSSASSRSLNWMIAAPRPSSPIITVVVVQTLARAMIP